MTKVSVIIPTYNRFKYLLNAIESVLNQTHKDIEVIVVNDCSTEEEYYSFDFNTKFGDNVRIIHLDKNSRTLFGKVCGGGNARNIGMMLSNAKYIAFLDDDDYFMPTKIEKQISAMEKTGCKISCTEAYTGKGVYDENKKYKTMHYNGVHWGALVNIYKNKSQLLNEMYKDEINIWTKEAIETHNCTCGGSSIIIDRNLIQNAGYFPIMTKCEDWTYWKKLIMYSKCVFLREPLTYLDENHGYGQEYR